MATPDSQDLAARERILKHMNADHQDSVQRYIEHLRNASFFQVRDARMTDISLTEMRIRYSGKEAVIPFEPPMKSMRDARERLVQMDQDALQALGRSDITVTKFIPCYVHPGHLFNFSQCLVTFIAFSRPSHFKPGSLLFDNLLYRTPSFASFCLKIQPFLIGIMVAIHAFEAAGMAKRLRKHGLTPLQMTWWLWVATCFIEGITSTWRLDGLVDQKRKEKEAKKH
ncbi:integral membrane protein-like protein [Westerdykella ornata]|uniref:Integral membrane protein-like protein n=1 Tax=Westerdykella ornata TaxID=318751 RepID=A0A6A6JPQ2_WESOR|nr:integral membrane protein-like protein [Westerdykella ornata]KAF2277656.1 integral membrane protein-like protein [Westerdykella ornata]